MVWLSSWQNVTLAKCRGADAAEKTTKRERKMISLVRKSFFPYFWKDFYFSLEIKKIPSYFRLLLTPRAITLKIFTAVINFTVSAGNFHPSLCMEKYFNEQIDNLGNFFFFFLLFFSFFSSCCFVLDTVGRGIVVG